MNNRRIFIGIQTPTPIFAYSDITTATTSTNLPSSRTEANTVVSPTYATATYLSNSYTVTILEAVPFNTSGSSRNLVIKVSITGTIPSGFQNAGTAFSFSGNDVTITFTQDG